MLDDLMTQCNYVRDQRDQVLKAIRTWYPNFVLKYEPPSRDYSVKVLRDLNANVSKKSW